MAAPSVDCQGVGNREVSKEVHDVIIGHPLSYASMVERVD